MLGGLLLGICMLGSASTARASYFYEVFDGAFNTGVKVAAGPVMSDTTIVTPNFNITIVSSFTVQGTLTTLDTQFQVHENTAGTHTITLKLVYTDYSMPSGSPLNVATSGSANFGDAAAGNTVVGQAWGNAANTSAFDTGLTAGPQTASNPSAGTNNGVVMTPNPAGFSFPRSGNFAMGQDIAITLTDNLNTTGQGELITTVAAVPAPAGVILAVTGLPLLGFGGWLRRRRK